MLEAAGNILAVFYFFLKEKQNPKRTLGVLQVLNLIVVQAIRRPLPLSNGCIIANLFLESSVFKKIFTLVRIVGCMGLLKSRI